MADPVAKKIVERWKQSTKTSIEVSNTGIKESFSKQMSKTFYSIVTKID